MDEKWKEVAIQLLNHNIDFVLSHLDKFNFGERDFITKLTIRLILSKLQTMIKTKNFSSHLRDLIKNVNTLVKK